jgi:hypothetical protein
MITAARMIDLVRTHDDWDIPMRRASILVESELSAMIQMDPEWTEIEGEPTLGGVAGVGSPVMRWWRAGDGGIIADMSLGQARALFVADNAGHPVLKITDAGANLKTIREVEALKARWVDDPTWDLASAAGFAGHREELDAYAAACRTYWAELESTRLARRARELGIPNAIGVVQLIESLEERLDVLEAKKTRRKKPAAETQGTFVLAG